MTETPTRLSSVVERLERRIRAEAIIGRVIDHFSIGPNEMRALTDELNVDRAITVFRGIPVVSSRAEGIRTLYRTRPSAPAPQTGRQRAAQIIADEIHRQGKLPEYQGLDAYEVHYPIDLGAIVDALVAAAPPEQNAYTPPERLTDAEPTASQLRGPMIFRGYLDDIIPMQPYVPRDRSSVKIPVRVTLKEGDEVVQRARHIVEARLREEDEFLCGRIHFTSSVEAGFAIDGTSNTIHEKNLVLGLRSVTAMDKPFGPDLIYWCGRIDVPDGEETRANAHHYRAAKSPYRGGNSCPDHRADNGELPHPSTGERP